MTFTFAALGATLIIAALPNALGVITGDMDKNRADVERNVKLTGDPYQLKKDLEKLQHALKWSVVLLACAVVIWLIVLTMAAGPLYILAIVDSLLERVS